MNNEKVKKVIESVQDLFSKPATEELNNSQIPTFITIDCKENPEKSFKLFDKDADSFGELLNSLMNEICDEKLSKEMLKNIVSDLYFLNGLNVTSLKKKLCDLKEKQYLMFERIYGIELVNKKVLKLGDNVFVKKENISDYIREKCDTNLSDNKKTLELLFSSNSSNDFSCVYFVFLCDAYDKDAALLIYSKAYSNVFALLKFIVGYPGKRSYIGKSFFSPFAKHTFCLSNGIIYKNFELNVKDKPIVLDSGSFIDPLMGFDKIWNFYNSASQNDIQKRISVAIKWVSRFFDEESDIHKCIDLCCALESLHQEKEGPFRPGIVSSLSEFVAYITNDNADSRMECERTIKDMYNFRSKGVHSGHDNESIVEIDNYLVITYATIAFILTNKPFCDCSSAKEINELIARFKYSYSLDNLENNEK